MPKNVGGGKKYKKRKTKVAAGPGKIMYPDDEQLYGIVVKRLGNGMLNLVVCDSNGGNIRNVLGRIRGILRKRRVPFFEGSYVIACGRPCDTGATTKEKVDVIHKYYDEHVRTLTREDRIPSEMKRQVSAALGLETKAGSGDHDEDDIVFDDGDDSDENERVMDDADIDDL